MYYALVYMSVALLASYALRLPHAVADTLAVGILVVTMVYKLRKNPAIREEPVADPGLLARVRVILASLGWTAVEPVIVNKPVPLLGRRNGKLSVPVLMGQVLSDPELMAAIAFSYASQRVARRELIRFWAPWAGALAAAYGVALYTGWPVYLPLAVGYVVWSQWRAPKGLSSVNAARAAMPEFLALQGNPYDLLAGMLKVNTLVLRVVRQQAVIGNIRGSILAVAQAAGISSDQLQIIGSAIGAARVLYTEPQ
ncbi:MAG TPA: hypothetical protein VK464_15210 [Symbiobacteriaceae bacterium]|nr:hypothetical protein [Symbiobacteriaceae bacterium]